MLTRYVEWRTDELSAAMREDKTVEAAMVSTLYRDVVRHAMLCDVLCAVLCRALRRDSPPGTSTRHFVARRWAA